ncbi:hypothetical protein RHMOL_Rhmol11G0092900 [Rhododendron molle]|uniref:Uncharacterized protein n=1 Tax=Rhododendron molle TaxID=49168 RepID=A0ACC0LR42_RHOML|nr:hypothetical protein RHMOL_Rhmol11G0092900 [Rhododendron molle]
MEGRTCRSPGQQQGLVPRVSGDGVAAARPFTGDRAGWRGRRAVLRDSNRGLFPGSPATAWQRLTPSLVTVLAVMAAWGCWLKFQGKAFCGARVAVWLVADLDAEAVFGIFLSRKGIGFTAEASTAGWDLVSRLASDRVFVGVSHRQALRMVRRGEG